MEIAGPLLQELQLVHTYGRVPAASEFLPGIQIALNAVNQIHARSYFDAVYIVSTADVELFA